jgi:MFS family permease
MHGGADTALGTASNRFAVSLPSDIDIPLYFAEFFYSHSHHGMPPEFPGEWLASDRPPLQVGYVLSQQPFAFNSHELNYLVLGICLQQLWIVGLWALLLAAGVGRLTKALVVIAVLLSPVAIVNGFFVWPKLLPAAMLLAAAALLVTPLWGEMRSRLWAGALVGALFGLAMMGHGSSAFPIVPLVLIPAFRGRPSWRWVAVALGVLIVVMAPWSAYQKWGDPPGNRLIKWQIGGAIDVDSRGSLQTIGESYEEAGIGGTIHNKAENVVTVSGGGMMADEIKAIDEVLGRGEVAWAVRDLRTILFLYLLPSLGLLLLGPLAMLAAIRRKRRGDPAEWRFARDLLLVFAVGVAAWCLLMFGNGNARTVIHQGSYFLPIIGVCAGVAGFRASFPRLGAWIVGISAALMLALYAPALDPNEGTSYSFASILLAAVFLGGFCWVALRREPDEGVSAPAESSPALAIDSPA